MTAAKKICVWIIRMTLLAVIPAWCCAGQESENFASTALRDHAGASENTALLYRAEDLPAAEKEYTVMVYMIGSNLESRLGNGTKDMKEMEKSGLDPAMSNLLVCTGGSKRWTGKVDSDFNSVLDFSREGKERLVAGTEENVNMGLPDMLAEFVNFCTENYPARHYALIFWDHGGGPLLGYGNDELFGSDGLLLTEMKTAMDRTRFSGRNKLDWVGFDACLMGSLECMYLWSNYAEYYVGSEELEPGDGWDYSFLSILNQTQDPEEITAGLVEQYGAYYEKKKTDTYDPDVTLSSIDLSEVRHLVAAIDSISDVLSKELKKGRYSSIQKVRTDSKSFGVVEDTRNESVYYYDLVDLKSLATRMTEFYPNEGKKILRQIEKTVTSHYTNVEDSGGISLYYPSRNKILYSENMDIFDDICISMDYSNYLKSLTALWNSATSREWDLGELKPGQEEYTLQLTEEQLQNYSEIYYNVYAKTNDGAYCSYLSHCRIEPDSEGVLHIPEDPGLFFLKSDSGERRCWPVVQTQEEDGRSVYQTEATRVESDITFYKKAEGDCDTLKITVCMDAAEGSDEIKIKEIRTAEDDLFSAGKNTLDLMEWEGISYSYTEKVPIKDRKGRTCPPEQWRKGDLFSICNLGLEEGLEVEIQPASETGMDCYCQVILMDTNGELYASKQAPAGRTHPYHSVEQYTKKGKLTFNVYEDRTELVDYDGTDTEISLPEMVDGKPLKVIHGAFGRLGLGVRSFPIRQITIPDSVEKIGNNAFMGCGDLKNIHLPGNLKLIGEGAFYCCGSLEEVTVPEGTEIIGKTAFACCKSLKKVNLPDSLKMIGTGVFMECKALEEIQITGDPEACISLDGALYSRDMKKLLAVPGAGIEELTVHDGTEEIAYGAVAGSSVRKVILPDTLRVIGNYSFYGCPQLQIPAFPDGLEYIGVQAFGTYSYSFGRADIPKLQQEIRIPREVSFIGSDAFSQFPARIFRVDPENMYFSSREGHLTNKAEDAILQFAAERDNLLVIPEGIVSFDWEALRYISEYDIFDTDNIDIQIYFPDSVKIFPDNGDMYTSMNYVTFCGSRGSEAEAYANDMNIPFVVQESADFSTVIKDVDDIRMTFRVFSDHASLTAIEGWGPDSKVTIPERINGVPVTIIGDGIAPVLGNHSYGEHPFYVKIPDTVTEIKKYAFQYNDLEDQELTLPKGLRVLEEEALPLGQDVENVVLPESIEYLGRKCISGDVRSFTLTPSIREISAGAFSACPDLKEFRCKGRNDLYTVKDGILFSADGKTLIAYPPGMEEEEIVIPEGTEVIGEEAFAEIYSFEKIYMPDSVREIGESAFLNCINLREIRFSGNLKVIKEYAFVNTGIESLTLPDTVTEIGKNAFESCTKLNTLFLPESLEKIGDGAFYYCEELHTVHFPEKLKTIGDKAFSKCIKLGNIDLPAGLEYIGEQAFSDWDSPIRSGKIDVFKLGSHLTATGDGPFGSLPIQKFSVEPDNTEFSSVEGFLTDKTGRVLLACPGGKKGAVYIPEGIEIIASYSFYFAQGVTDLYLPESLTYIEGVSFSEKSEVTVNDAGEEEYHYEVPIRFHVRNGSYGHQYAVAKGWDFEIIPD